MDDKNLSLLYSLRALVWASIVGLVLGFLTMRFTCY